MAQSTTKKSSSTTAATPKTPNKTTTDLAGAGKRGRPRKNHKSNGDKENAPPPDTPSPATGGGHDLVNTPNVPAALAGLNTTMADENRLLKEKLALIEAQMAAAKAAQQVAEQAAQAAQEAAAAATEEAGIEELVRPPGEAGSGTRGFNLQEAMGLEGDVDLYKNIWRNVRTQVHVVQLDLSLPWSKQDVTKLSNIYRKMHKDFPYLTTKRFRGNWALGDMIKSYARGLHKVQKRKGDASSSTGSDDKHDNDNKDEENANNDGDALRLSKKRRLNDDE